MSKRLQMWVVAGLMVTGCSGPSSPDAKEAEVAPTIQDGMTVMIDYTLTIDGEIIDSSEGGSPLSYVQGEGQIVPGLERQLVGLSAGDEAQVTVNPEDGYGMINPEAFVEVPKAQLPPGTTPEIGQILQGTNQEGRPFRARIDAVGEDHVTLDRNHPLAGKTLQFDITVVQISPSQS